MTIFLPLSSSRSITSDLVFVFFKILTKKFTFWSESGDGLSLKDNDTGAKEWTNNLHLTRAQGLVLIKVINA